MPSPLSDIVPGQFLDVAQHPDHHNDARRRLNILEGTRLDLRDYLPGPYSAADDHTTAFANMLAAFRALPILGRNEMYVPAGQWNCGSLGNANMRYLALRGAGIGRTQIDYTGPANSWFLEFGVFSAAPADIYAGGSQDFDLRGFTLRCPAQIDYANEGLRTRGAFRDNGSGNGFLDKLVLEGFQYGYASPYGGDFVEIKSVVSLRNDVGLYIGRSSQQTDISTCSFFANVEGLVYEASKQGRCENSWFVDNRDSHITFDVGDTTRFGLTAPIITGSDYYHELIIDIEDCWFEAAAGYRKTAGDTSPRFIWLRQKVGGSTSMPKFIRIQRPYVLSGSTAGTNAFAEVQSGDRLTIEEPKFDGASTKYVVDRKATAHTDSRIFVDTPHLSNHPNAAMEVFNRPGINCRVRDRYLAGMNYGEAITPQLPGVDSYISPEATAVDTAAFAVGDMRLAPIYLPATIRAGALGLEVTVAAAAGGTYVLCLYADEDPKGVPFPVGKPSKLLASGSVDSTTVGVKILAIDVVLQPSRYWVGAFALGSAATVRRVSASGRPAINTSALTTWLAPCWRQDALAAAPDPFAGYTSDTFHRVSLKRIFLGQ